MEEQATAQELELESLRAQVQALETENARLTKWAGVEVEAARADTAEAVAENHVWRQLIAEFRELIVPISQSFPMSKPYKRIRECMADPRIMDAEVQSILAAQRKARESASVNLVVSP